LSRICEAITDEVVNSLIDKCIPELRTSSGLQNDDERCNCQISVTKPHPVIVVIRIKPEISSRSQQLRAMIGEYLKAVQLILLTLLFGSVWGGSLFLTAAFVTVFFTIIFLGRIYSIWIYIWLQEAALLTVIECDSQNEMREMATILSTMPKVSVESKTDSYRYCDGYAICPGTEQCNVRHSAKKVLQCAGVAAAVTIIQMSIVWGLMPIGILLIGIDFATYSGSTFFSFVAIYPIFYLLFYTQFGMLYVETAEKLNLDFKPKITE